MNNLNIDESSVQSIEKIRFKKIFGKWCLTNKLSSETEILSFAIKRCNELTKKIEKTKKKIGILENDFKIKQKPWKKLRNFLKSLVEFRRERNIKLKVADRLDYCDLIQPYHQIVCTYRKNQLLLKKLQKNLGYIQLFICLSK